MRAQRVFGSCLGTVLLAGVLLAAQVTIKVSVDDPSGSFIPNLRPENFVVYENGIRQSGVTAEVEHAAVTLAVLLEGGGRYQQINKILTTEVPYVSRPLVEILKRDDTVAVLSYRESVRTLFDFDHPNDKFAALFDALPEPVYSEANLYDALVDVLNRTAAVPGRKAVLLISTGVDTFSHANFDAVQAQAERSKTPVYVIGLSDTVLSTLGAEGPVGRIDWKRINEQLKTLSKVSGGRAYLRSATLDIRAIYDDIMEHLRVRYVLKYVSAGPDTPESARSIRVVLVNPRTGTPLRVVDRTGKTITPTVTVQACNTP
jgi:VWFA-related protein